MAGELSYLMAVASLKRRVAAYVEGLETMRRISWHTERDDLMLCIILVKLGRSVATVTV